MRKTAYLVLPAVLGLLLAGCGSSNQQSGTASSGATSTSSAVLKTANSALGDIVVDAKGRTVYVFNQDEPGSGKSACSGQCATNWPPVTVESSSPGVDGVTGDVATITRDDGSMQVTLDGRPLYLYAGDRKPGDTTGQGVQNVWWVVTPDGAVVTATGAPQGPSY